MQATDKEFLENLSQSGLLSAAEISAIRADSANMSTLGTRLIESGKLTEYQFEKLSSGESKGLVFGEYVVEQKIGSGGMGHVYLAQHRKMKRKAAIKTLPERFLDSPNAVDRFHQEVEAAARLIHGNIVITYDAGEQNGTHFLVMEYIKGRDLAAVTEQEGALPVNKAIDCILQAANGLKYAHKQGIIHRDIKPANLLLAEDGTLKISDMGLARIATAEVFDETANERLTETGHIMGTCDFMSPEQASTPRDVDHRTDIYSLGCTLYRLLTGTSPFNGDSVIQVILAHRESPIPSLLESSERVPAELDAVFRRMVAKNPQERYQSMGEVINALESLRASAALPKETIEFPVIPGSQVEHPTLQLNDDTLPDQIPESAGSSTPKSRSLSAEAKVGNRGCAISVTMTCLVLMLSVFVYTYNKAGRSNVASVTSGQNDTKKSEKSETKNAEKKAEESDEASSLRRRKAPDESQIEKRALNSLETDAKKKDLQFANPESKRGFPDRAMPNAPFGGAQGARLQPTADLEQDRFVRPVSARQVANGVVKEVWTINPDGSCHYQSFESGKQKVLKGRINANQLQSLSQWLARIDGAKFRDLSVPLKDEAVMTIAMGNKQWSLQSTKLLESAKDQNSQEFVRLFHAIQQAVNQQAKE